MVRDASNDGSTPAPIWLERIKWMAVGALLILLAQVVRDRLDTIGPAQPLIQLPPETATAAVQPTQISPEPPETTAPPPKSKNKDKKAAFSIYVNGEPGVQDGHAGRFDLILANDVSVHRQHDNIFWPNLLGGGIHYEPAQLEIAAVPSARRPIDLLYQSSNCNPLREQTVSVLRQSIEDAGLRFEYSGKCRAGSNKKQFQFNNLGISKTDLTHPGYKAKMMIAMSKHVNSDSESMDEKLSLPMRFGAIPLYKGNGQRLAKQAGIANTSFLDRKNFVTDQDFARAVVRLAKSNEILDRMRDAGAVGLLSRGEKNESFFGPFNRRACAPIKTFVSLHPNKPDHDGVLTVKSTCSSAYWTNLLGCVFGDREFRFQKVGKVDITLQQCCWGC